MTKYENEEAKNEAMEKLSTKWFNEAARDLKKAAREVKETKRKVEEVRSGKVNVTIHFKNRICRTKYNYKNTNIKKPLSIFSEELRKKLSFKIVKSVCRFLHGKSLSAML